MLVFGNGYKKKKKIIKILRKLLKLKEKGLTTLK